MKVQIDGFEIKEENREAIITLSSGDQVIICNNKSVRVKDKNGNVKVYMMWEQKGLSGYD